MSYLTFIIFGFLNYEMMEMKWLWELIMYETI